MTSLNESPTILLNIIIFIEHINSKLFKFVF